MNCSSPRERLKRLQSIARDANQEIGRILKRHREEQSLTQRHLALKADLDYSYVSKIENGLQNPSVESMIRLAEALEMPGSEINELLALIGRLPENMPLNERRRLALHYPEWEH